MSDVTMLLSNGCKWQPFEPDRCIDNVTADVLATHLSRICRYGGAVWLSVAEHSVLVARIVEDWLDDERTAECRVDPDRRHNLLLAALLHDAHEALSGWGDVQAPVKRALDCGPILAQYERDIDRSIALRFELAPLAAAEDRFVHQADHAARLIERYVLFGHPMTPRDGVGGPVLDWCRWRCERDPKLLAGLLPDAARQLFLDHWCRVDQRGGSS